MLLTNTPITSSRKFSQSIDCDLLVGTRRGYYLVVKHTGTRHFMAENLHTASRKLESMCNKHLTDEHYGYYVHYSHGLDIDGRVAWADFTCTDKLLDVLESEYC